MPFVRSGVEERQIEHLLGLDSSKIGFYSEVKQKIQELETANLELEAKRNELQALFDSIGDGVVIFDLEGRVQHRNHVCPKLLPDQTAPGETCAGLFHPRRRRSPGTCPVEAALRGSHRTASFTANRDGRTRYFEASATPIAGFPERPQRALVFLRDVTERRIRERQLVQTEKMSSIGLLAAGVAHEINNPLTSVGGYAEALLRRRRDDDGLRDDPRLQVFWDYLAVIMREAHRCKGIIDTLLSFSRRNDGVLGPVALNPLVEEVMELVAFSARQRCVDVVTELDDALPPVRGDAGSLRQVLLNLALNAVQAAAESGRVRIATGRDAAVVFLRVEDDGVGIPSEHLDQIWDPFFTTKPVGQGLGLGLSVTYDIVQAHGGEIQVRSDAGGGAEFTVRLPIAGNS